MIHFVYFWMISSTEFFDRSLHSIRHSIDDITKSEVMFTNFHLVWAYFILMPFIQALSYIFPPFNLDKSIAQILFSYMHIYIIVYFSGLEFKHNSFVKLNGK